ncbi:MAG: hypothetical protein PHQ40_19325, partial [Anaerolineaceae bacterium]|nr:hypothetical protein [Anaerolineaceae bacterium]
EEEQQDGADSPAEEFDGKGSVHGDNCTIVGSGSRARRPEGGQNQTRKSILAVIPDRRDKRISQESATIHKSLNPSFDSISKSHHKGQTGLAWFEH